MTLASLSEFGSIYGVSKQAAAKWKAAGHLVIRDGRVDVEASGLRLAALGRTTSPAYRLLARRIRTAWLDWPATAGPAIAERLGVDPDAATAALAEQVHRHLATLADVEADFAEDPQ